MTIDSGISYAHGDFDNAAGNTRIVRIWDHNYATGPSPAPYGYGTEYLPAAIDANTAQGKDTNGHGTHVMGIAAGDGSLTGGAIPAYTYVGIAPMADIVEIKPVSYTDTAILDGASYFFGLATTLGQNAVLNISLGGQYGPHDGTQPLSVGLDALTGPGKAICASAGNDGGSTGPANTGRSRRRDPRIRPNEAYIKRCGTEAAGRDECPVAGPVRDCVPPPSKRVSR